MVCSLPQPSADAVTALAPTGRLRVGINLSNTLLVTGHRDDGDPVGVSPDLAAALARNLGVPLDLVTFASPGELADAAVEEVWDIGNIGADPARAEHINFTAPYSEIESTYLVRGDSHITKIAQVDQPGIRVASKVRAAYTLLLERLLTRATLILTDSADASFDAFAADEVDVLAGLRPRLQEDADRLPNARLLDGRFATVEQAIGMPKDRHPAGVAHLEAFVETAVRSGLVASLINRYGLVGRLSVARQ